MKATRQQRRHIERKVTKKDFQKQIGAKVQEVREGFIEALFSPSELTYLEIYERFRDRWERWAEQVNESLGVQWIEVDAFKKEFQPQENPI